MRIKNNVFTRFQALTTLLALALFAGSAIAGAPKEPKEFDRLDGRGPSHGKIDVIDWQGNIEIHSYPKGKLAGLGFKLDKKDKNKPVLVISYRFAGVDYKIIRRALDTVGLKEGFKTYRDTTADDYDKIILTNNILNTDVIAFNPDPAPTQLYPDWHESLGGGAEAEDAALAAKDAADGEKLDSTRKPAEIADAPKTYARPKTQERAKTGIQFQQSEKESGQTEDSAPRWSKPSTIDEDGAIKGFNF